MKKLLPCPFCGGEAGIERTGTPRQSCIVACVNCGARHESGDEAQFSGASWNRRTQPAITSENGNAPPQGASAITSGTVPLHQILTDPENQPNQFGVKFLMHGPKFAFKVGAQKFTLDYEPTKPGEFEFMRDALIHAFSTFTPDVKTAQAVPLLTDEEIEVIATKAVHEGRLSWLGFKEDADGRFTIPSLSLSHYQFAAAIEAAVRSKLGAGVPMTDAQMRAAFAMAHPQDHADMQDGSPANAVERIGARNVYRRFERGIRAAERHHGIVGKEGGK